jgi:hypothetical protein
MDNATVIQRKRRLASLLRRTKLDHGCIAWNGSIGDHGYGQYRTEDSNPTVHRMLWETFIGDIPEGYEVHHVCGNRLCVNPFHLTVLSQTDHWRLGNSPSAKRARATQCKNGHEFTPENTYVRTKTGHRRCRKCHAASERARKQPKEGT